jgi:hypothetical protein
MSIVAGYAGESGYGYVKDGWYEYLADFNVDPNPDNWTLDMAHFPGWHDEFCEFLFDDCGDSAGNFVIMDASKDNIIDEGEFNDQLMVAFPEGG